MNPIIDKIASSVIGRNQMLTTPFGAKPLIYADYTASGRSLSFIEDYIRDNILPWYANTHTETSVTGAQTTKLREESRAIIKHAVNANAKDKVIFCGSGATAAINKLIDMLGIRIPRDLDKKYALSNHIPHSERPVVFIGPYEHHSNELPWRECLADVVTISLDDEGQIDTHELTAKLNDYRYYPLKIGSFSAASNVTGIKSDILKITAILKSHNALSFWDYAAAAPYIAIDMNADVPIDAAFISPHKFVGGPSTPGILVVKGDILNNSVPAIVGGGTVSYVTPTYHRYIEDIERREEGGTPAIVGSVRAGLVFKLQQEVSLATIEELERKLVHRAMTFFNDIPQLDVLGNKQADRLSIFSLRFKHHQEDLHHGFVTALLNDLFGIQVRGGCSCAGPYGHHLLGMSIHYSQKIEREITRGFNVLRPGWVRLNFNYFISDDEFHYILQAIKLVAEHGWRILPYYQLDQRTTNWHYQGNKSVLPCSLYQLSFLDHSPQLTTKTKPNFKTLLNDARDALWAPQGSRNTFELQLSPSAEKWRWFVLPQQCYSLNLDALVEQD